jgi:hypothetical protein
MFSVLQVCGGVLCRRKVAVLTDERVRIMNEILTGIRVIKMYCWEHMFGDLIKNVRRYVHLYSLPAVACTLVYNGND